jgi:hypothetical protein
MHQYGHVPGDAEIRTLSLPDTLVDICPGDFLGSDTTTGVLTAALIQTDQAWDTNLTTTQVAAAAKFIGVSLQEIDSSDGVCNDRPDCIPVAWRRTGNRFRRAYRIVDTDGADAPTTWIIGQGFTFGKVAGSNLLSNNTIQKSTTAGDIVFRAVKSSGPDAVAYAEVEFST